MQRIINANYNQRIFSLPDLTTNYDANTCLALPNACRRSVRTFSVITTSVVNEKIAGVDCTMR
jgi:hypothetical protein